MDRKPQVQKFDPQKNYEWNVDDLFTVSGEEIDAWNKALVLTTQDPEFQKFVHIYRAKLLMEKFIKESVESGLIRETTPSKEPPILQEST